MMRRLLFSLSFALCLLHTAMPHGHASSLSASDKLCAHEPTSDWLQQLERLLHQDLGGDHLSHYLPAPEFMALPDAFVPVLLVGVLVPDIEAPSMPKPLVAFGRRPLPDDPCCLAPDLRGPPCA